MKHNLRKLKRAWVDVKAVWDRRCVGPHQGNTEHRLQPYQVYPKGHNLSAGFLTEPRERYPKWIRKDKTRVASIGSCFAVEVRRYLNQAGFQFVSTRDSWAGSADWGRVYTPKNMLQIFQQTFGRLVPAIRWVRSDREILDPYREGISYRSEAEVETEIHRHDKASRTALTDCDILIITPGQNEAWVESESGLAWARKPPPEAFVKYGRGRFSIRQYTLEENILFLDEALALLWKANPAVKVILTVSPVPSSATFVDENVGVRSFENKAILLLAVKEMVRRYPEKTFYFPSLEIALVSRNANLEPDNRHVRPRVIDDIMASFEKSFVRFR